MNARMGAATSSVAMATFLMTDIEGSTRLWEEHPDSMAVVLERHDVTLHRVVEEHDGTVVKTTGDGLLAAFVDPVAAVLAAIDGQRRLESLSSEPETPVRVRMALHTGDAQARDGDYFGPALNRVARLLAIGHGGQVLLSGVTAELARDRLGPDVALIDRGEHVLRDLVLPERVHQLAAPGLARDFPPLRSRAVDRVDLPVQVTSFVGRDRELADLERLSASHRLVTLIGTGGTGKTRLMLEAFGPLADRFRDGIRLAELAPISDPDLIATEVLRAVGGRDQSGATSIDALVDHLRYKELLLLLDNCEHVIAVAADVAYRLLTNCPDVTIVASSREALGIDGETIYQVPSLGLARGGSTSDPHTEAGPDRYAEIADAGAIRLFVDRAAAVVPGFELTRENAPTIAEICERLDGIPLAIELAAARVAVLSVDDILRRLGDRFRLLTGGRRTAVPRQQTLQALVDWSWDLLAEPDRRLLRRLSVFAGGWTLEAAAAICGEAGDDVTETLDALERLVERSLATVDRSGPATRYRMLETIRQYARDRLIESGESDAVRRAHLAYVEAYVEAEAPRMKGPDLGEALGRIDAEIDNIRVAIEWGLDADPETAGRLCAAMWLYWRSRLTGEEAADWLAAAVDGVRALTPVDDPVETSRRAILLSRLLSGASFARATMSNQPAVAWAEESVALARSVDDDDALSQGLGALWTARWFIGDRDGRAEDVAEARAVATRLGDLWSLSFAEASAAAESAIQSDDPTEARALLDRAVAHARETGNPFAIAFTTMSRGRLLGVMGDMDAARPAFDEAFAAYSSIGDDRFALATRSDLGHALRTNGQLDEAEAVYRSTIHEWERLGHRGAIANQLESFAYLALERDALRRAARLLGAAEALRESSGETMVALEREAHAVAVDDLRSRLEPSALAVAWAAGRSLTMPAAVALAVAADDGSEASEADGAPDR